MGKSYGRLAGAVSVLTVLVLGGVLDGARADMMMIEPYESYLDSNDLRLSWVATPRVPPLTIDLETSAGIKGPAQEGTKYMRVNFLFSPTYIAFDMGGVDFSAYDQLHVWFRGIPYPANDVIEMRVEMVGSSSSWWGQVEPDVSTCPYVEGETYCDWGEHIVDFAAWDGKSDVQEVRLHVLSQMGNAEFYIDSIQLTGVPLDSDHETWGSVKALYH